MEENLTEGFNVFNLPLDQCRPFQTTNSLERIYVETRQRTKGLVKFQTKHLV